MKKDKIIYWIITALISLMMLFSAYSYLTSEEIKGAFVHLGFPSWFRIELAAAKALAAIALILPWVSIQLKGFAYAGLAITFISAAIAHITSGDPAQVIATPLIFLAVLAVSYFYLHKTKELQPA